MRFEKNAQLVAALYDFTNDAGTNMEPLVDQIPVPENAFEFERVHKTDATKYIVVRLEQC